MLTYIYKFSKPPLSVKIKSIPLLLTNLTCFSEIDENLAKNTKNAN